MRYLVGQIGWSHAYGFDVRVTNVITEDDKRLCSEKHGYQIIDQREGKRYDAKTEEWEDIRVDLVEPEENLNSQNIV